MNDVLCTGCDYRDIQNQKLRDELSALREWKHSAMIVFDAWEEVYELCKTDAPSELGKSKAGISLEHVSKMKQENSALREAAKKQLIDLATAAVEKLRALDPEAGYDSGEKVAEMYIRNLPQEGER